MTHEPKITMLVATDDTYATVKRTVGCLLKQTAIKDIELIVACTSKDRLAPDMKDLEEFGSYQIVERPGAIASGQFLGAAAKAARAPAFMYLEEHNFPPPRTAEVAIRELNDNDRPAVGFAMLPSNPGWVSWAHIYGQFGPVVAPVKSGPIHRLGGHHAAYQTSFLLQLGDALDDLMNNEAVLHEHLRAQGTPMYLTSDVVIPHTQISDLRTLIRQEYLAQRVFAGTRTQVMGWSPARRALYVFGAPLIPIKRSIGAAYHIFRTGRAARLLIPVLPLMFVAQCAGTVGEALGYVFGAADKNIADRMEIELDRYAFVNDSDQKDAQSGRFIRSDSV